MDPKYKYAIGLGAAALIYTQTAGFTAQTHSFQPSPTISRREDRFKVLNVKAGEPLKAPMGEYFLNKDGLYIHFRRWSPSANIHPLPPKGVVIIVHGLGEHIARYDHVAKALNNAGLVVYGLDHQGHGRSEGDRMFLKSFTDYVEDVLLLVEIAKNENPLLRDKVFLMGHSMGGLISILTLGKAQKEFAGAVISGPAVSIDPNVVTPATKTLMGFLSSSLPRVPIDALNIETLVQFMPIKDLYQNDPLVYHGKITARLGHELVSSIEVAMSEVAPKISLPYLLFHGTGDKICPISGSEEFHSKTASQSKKFVRLEAGHEALNEVNGEAVKVVVDWLKSRL